MSIPPTARGRGSLLVLLEASQALEHLAAEFVARHDLAVFGRRLHLVRALARHLPDLCELRAERVFHFLD